MIKVSSTLWLIFLHMSIRMAGMVGFVCKFWPKFLNRQLLNIPQGNSSYQHYETVYNNHTCSRFHVIVITRVGGMYWIYWLSQRAWSINPIHSDYSCIELILVFIVIQMLPVIQPIWITGGTLMSPTHYNTNAIVHCCRRHCLTEERCWQPASNRVSPSWAVCYVAI